MQTNEQLRQGLVVKVYDAAMDDSLWESLAHDVARAFNSHSTAIQLRTPELGTQVLGCTSNIRLKEYIEYYGDVDPWVEGGVRCGANRILLSEDLVQPGDLERSEFYCDWAVKGDQYHIVGCMLDVTSTQLAGFGIHRARRQAGYDEEDRRLVGEFAVHLRRALQLRARLKQVEREKAWSLEALARSNCAFFVLDEHCKVIFASPKASPGAGPARPFRIQAGRLFIDSPALHRRFAAMVSDAVATASGRPAWREDALAIPRGGQAPVTIAVSPLPALPDSAPRALVFIRDASHGHASSETLQALFGLTAAEARVALELTRGASVEDISARWALSRNTVRTHVQRVLSKTQTARQGEFVSLALRTVATMHGSGQDACEGGAPGAC